MGMEWVVYVPVKGVDELMEGSCALEPQLQG